MISEQTVKATAQAGAKRAAVAHRIVGFLFLLWLGAGRLRRRSRRVISLLRRILLWRVLILLRRVLLLLGRVLILLLLRVVARGRRLRVGPSGIRLVLRGVSRAGRLRVRGRLLLTLVFVARHYCGRRVCGWGWKSGGWWEGDSRWAVSLARHKALDRKSVV